jgi:hypothetical protein
MFGKIALLPKDSNLLPGRFITGESITNTNNSTNILKNSKLFLCMPIETSRSCMIKNTGEEKSHDTVPLRVVLSFSLFICFLHLIWLICFLFYLKVYGIPHTETYTEFRGILRY